MISLTFRITIGSCKVQRHKSWSAHKKGNFHFESIKGKDKKKTKHFYDSTCKSLRA